MAPLQIVLYGATGFTGSLAAKYIAETYGDSIRWGIAGRNQAKLEKLAASLKVAPAEILIADSGDDDALAVMCARTAAVATTAGPFARYGSKLVAACAASGTHYCDITGEVDWLREMVALHDDAARASGANIVSLCGHDSVPWDITTHMLAKKINGNGGEELVRVDMYDKMLSAPSGGTIETAWDIMFGGVRDFTASRALGFDPLLKQPSGEKGQMNTVNRNVKVMDFGSPSRAFFVMSGVNLSAVKRSNAINGYGRRVEYCEGVANKTILHSAAQVLGLAIFGLLVAFPPTRWIVKRFFLPKPGEGPSEEFMDRGFLEVVGKAVGSRGSKVEACIRFPVDPGYKDTARMLVESALALSVDSAKVKAKGGVFTPGCCQGEVLLERLVRGGTTFEYTREDMAV